MPRGSHIFLTHTDDASNIFMKIGYDEVFQIRKMIDNIELNNEDVYKLNEKLDDIYDEMGWENMKSIFYKLNYKQLHKTSIDGKLTYYGFIMKEHE